MFLFRNKLDLNQETRFTIRDRLAPHICLLFIGWHARAVSLPPGDILLAQLACLLNGVTFCLNWDVSTNNSYGLSVAIKPILQCVIMVSVLAPCHFLQLSYS
jgi:hypothetical protein